MDDPIGSQFLVQLLLILINAFFAATETAVVSMNENKIRRQAEDGDKKAVQMLKMVESPTRFLSTIQVCITLSGFLASAFAADHFASILASALLNAGFTLLLARGAQYRLRYSHHSDFELFHDCAGRTGTKAYRPSKPREGRPLRLRYNRLCLQSF